MCRKGWTPLIFANLSYSSEDQVTVHFINRDGERLTTTAKEGETLLQVVVNHNLSIDGFGRCCSRIYACALRASGYLGRVQQYATVLCQDHERVSLPHQLLAGWLTMLRWQCNLTLSHCHSSSLWQCFWLHGADVKIWKLMMILPEKRQAGNCIHLLCFLASLLTCSRSVKGPFLTLFLKMVSLTLLFFLICCPFLASPPGACEGTLACSTCHLIFDKDTFQKLDAISDEELDMLDLAYGLTDT